MVKKGKVSSRISTMTLGNTQKMDAATGIADYGGETGKATASIDNAGLEGSISVEARVVGMKEEAIFRHIVGFL